MRMRLLLVMMAPVVLVLCLGAIAAAQDAPRVLVRADRVVRDQPDRTTYIGNVVFTIDGVTVRASRAVLQLDEVVLDGTVRLTLPKGAYVFTQPQPAVRRQVAPAPPPAPVPLRLGPMLIDPPMPKPWQPPARDQR